MRCLCQCGCGIIRRLHMAAENRRLIPHKSAPGHRDQMQICVWCSRGDHKKGKTYLG